MPTCPGCQQQLTYTELRAHVNSCKWVWSARPDEESGLAEHLAIDTYVREYRAAQRSYLAEIESRVERREE